MWSAVPLAIACSLALGAGPVAGASPDDEVMTAEEEALFSESFAMSTAESGYVLVAVSCSHEETLVTCYGQADGFRIVLGTATAASELPPASWTIREFVDVATVSVPATSTTQPAPEAVLTTSQQAAVRSAQSYLEVMGFSRQGLIDQLSSEFGDQYPVEDATVAVDSLVVDWNAEAVESATSYLEVMGFSCQGLIDQLSSEYGDQYTSEQASFAATQVGLC